MAWRGEYPSWYVMVGKMFLVRMVGSLFLAKKFGLHLIVVED
jgi:hypothetical protein